MAQVRDNIADIKKIDTIESDVAQLQTDLNNFDALPDQTGEAGNFLTTDGSVTSWSTLPVTSVNGETGAVTIDEYTPPTDEGASSFLAGDGTYKSISYNDITDNPENVINKETYTATAGQTDFNINHTPGMVDVYLNGIRLTETVDFSGDGTTVTLVDAAEAGDIVSLFAMSDLATYIGALDTDQVEEGSTNLYYTDTKARAAISASGDLNYNSGTGEISFSESVTSVNSQTGDVDLTSDLNEVYENAIDDATALAIALG